jgi:hypothetical protein
MVIRRNLQIPTVKEEIWLFEGISKYQWLKKKSNATVLNVPASVHTQMT